jgi:hypothetical protein
MDQDVKKLPEFAPLSTQASTLSLEQLYDKSLEAWDRAEGFRALVESKAAGPKVIEGNFSDPDSRNYFRELAESKHQYPTDVEYKQLEILETRQAIWGLLYAERNAQEIAKNESHRRDQTINVPIATARKQLEKYLPQAVTQAASEINRAHDHSWHDKHHERLFLNDDQKGPTYQLDILRLAGATTIPVAINDHQTALERVREINIGVTSSLRNLSEQSRQAALDRYQPNDTHQRTIPFAKSLEFVRDYITKTQSPSLPKPIAHEQNMTR